MFRGKESSIRIELSRLVQDLNFGVLGSLWLWRGDRWVGGGVSGGMGVSPHTCTCMHTHVYMYRNYKWPLPWKHPCLSFLQHVYNMHGCVCACMPGTLSHTPIPMPTPIHPPAAPRGRHPESVKIQ